MQNLLIDRVSLTQRQNLYGLSGHYANNIDIRSGVRRGLSSLQIDEPELFRTGSTTDHVVMPQHGRHSDVEVEGEVVEFSVTVLHLDSLLTQHVGVDLVSQVGERDRAGIH